LAFADSILKELKETQKRDDDVRIIASSIANLRAHEEQKAAEVAADKADSSNLVLNLDNAEFGPNGTFIMQDLDDSGECYSLIGH